jgi:hypothetical protein
MVKKLETQMPEVVCIMNTFENKMPFVSGKDGGEHFSFFIVEAMSQHGVAKEEAKKMSREFAEHLSEMALPAKPDGKLHLCGITCVRPGWSSEQLLVTLGDVWREELKEGRMYLGNAGIGLTFPEGYDHSKSTLSSKFLPETGGLNLFLTPVTSQVGSRRDSLTAAVEKDAGKGINFGKALGSSKLARLRGIPTSEVACFGNDANDMGMMKWAGQSVCPNDATDEIKAVCKTVMDFSFQDDAVAHYIAGAMQAKTAAAQ